MLPSPLLSPAKLNFIIYRETSITAKEKNAVKQVEVKVQNKFKNLNLNLSLNLNLLMLRAVLRLPAHPGEPADDNEINEEDTYLDNRDGECQLIYLNGKIERS